ncbi:MAG TPA: segregation/condensation protein A [Thermodesulfobacteriota bacterium]|nr:segregation/condensation protein A [Thermodesulfobacteriota bacterium]
MTLDDTRPEENQAYTVRLDMFEGPLDLLLHLIKKNKLNITDIPIALITEQYLETLKLMKVLNLEIAGEFLLMAATLLHIKSKMLLPASSEGEEEEEVDPRAELIRKLLEYQKYKQASEELGKRPLLDRDVFTRPASQDREEPEEEKIEVNLFELLEAFRQVLKRARIEAFHEVTLESITVEEKIQEILSMLQREKRSMAFQTLFPEQSSRRIVVVTFLAILELVKTKAVRIFQAGPFETIRISLL